jgi:hypothetical protein
MKLYRWFANDTKGAELLTMANSSTEIPTAYPANPVVYFNALALTSTYFNEGDRIVFELESIDNNAVTTSWLHGLRYGAITGGNRSYVNLSANLIYPPPVAVVTWQGQRSISALLGTSQYPAATLATATKSALTSTISPYNITSGLTTTKLLKYKCNVDICWYWVQAYRDGKEIATNSPIGISPPPFEAIVSDIINTVKNEENIVAVENTTLAVEQVIQSYVERQPLGKAMVGTKE